MEGWKYLILVPKQDKLFYDKSFLWGCHSLASVCRVAGTVIPVFRP